jgi:hypothetical protein
MTTQRTFRTLKDVGAFLEGQGFVAKRSTLSRHKKSGRIRPEKSGHYSEKRVLQYARDFLRRAETGLREADENSEIAREKQREEVRKLRAQANAAEFDLDVKRGKYIPRTEVELAFAARAGVLEARLKQLFMARVSDWVFMVGGDAARAQDLLTTLQEELDAAMDEYARTQEFEVEFDEAD